MKMKKKVAKKEYYIDLQGKKHLVAKPSDRVKLKAEDMRKMKKKKK